MNIDLGSLAFGSFLDEGAGTPSWGTALGQSAPQYYITRDGADELVMGMVYCSVPLETTSLPLGKGGRFLNCQEAGVIQIASLFKKVYVNGTRINHPFIMVLQKEDSSSHSGRRSIKYPEKATFVNGEEQYANVDFFRAVAAKFELQEKACWFVYDISVSNYEDLHLKAIFVNKNDNETYINSRGRSEEWAKLIEESGDKYIAPNKSRRSENDLPLQQIFYGAPGTGKSFGITKETDKHPGDNVIRTTFHPDSDYSTFVGAYKPTKKDCQCAKKQKILDYDSLVDKFKEYLNAPGAVVTKACCMFGYDYHDSIVEMQNSGHKVPDLVTDAYKSNTTFDSVVRGGMACYENSPQTILSEDTITYEFVPQAFTQAYIKAWKNFEQPVFLIIEEINRGNCAQIFGDIFQLLDRNDEGFSSYEIHPDNDLKKFIADNKLQISDITNKAGEDISEKLMSGELMSLPPNLHIWATMNTSDQSLFPIDSAFKRRWDWKYVPIDTSKENWSIMVNGSSYSWGQFLDKMNAEIGEVTSSEDKKMGFYFCKTPDGIIKADKFVGKVLFYVYNDVFKDYGFDRECFKDGDKTITFHSFFLPNGDVNEPQVEKLLKKLKVNGTEQTPEDLEDKDETTRGRKESLVSVTYNGEKLTLEGRTQFELYLDTLKKIGIDTVAPIIENMKYRRLECPLISKTKYEPIENSRGYNYVQVGDYYVVKGVKYYTLIRILEDLKNKHGFDVHVEFR